MTSLMLRAAGPRSSARRTSAVLAAAALAALELAGCGHKETAHESEIAKLPPLAVQTVRVGGEAAGADVTLPGRVKAREEVTLVARFPGRVTGLPVGEGAGFRAGTVLVAFDAPAARSAVRAAAAGVVAAEVHLENARLQESRMETLYQQKVAALHELELARGGRRAAEAEYEAAVAQAEQLKSQTSMAAPFDGIMVRHFVDPGAEVSPGQPLASVRSSGGGIEIEVAVPESDLPRVSVDEVWFQVGDGPWRRARVARIEGMTDYATRTRVAHLRPAAGPAPEPGAYARVRFAGRATAATSSADEQGTGRDSVSAARMSNVPARGPAAGAVPVAALLVPESCLVRRGALTGLFVVEDGQASLRWVRPGRRIGGDVQILAGLFPGDEVAASAAGLEDGRRVSVSSGGDPTGPDAAPDTSAAGPR